MEPDAEEFDALAWNLLSLYRQVLSAGRLDVAEHLLRALERFAAMGSSRAALDEAYLDLAAYSERGRSAT